MLLATVLLLRKRFTSCLVLGNGHYEGAVRLWQSHKNKRGRYAMNDVFTADTIKNLLAPLLEKGFSFEYTHEKGGDSSCVYIGRFRKGKDFFDWREVSGGNEINFVVFVKGEYKFPSLKYLYKKEFRSFKLKHLLRKETLAEKRAFYARLLLKELQNKPDFFGIEK